MRKLSIGTRSIVLFLERREQAIFTRLCRDLGQTAAVQTLLEHADADLPQGLLTVEAFAREGKYVLFITVQPKEERCAVFRFDSADHLIDAVRSLASRIAPNDRSTLWECDGALFLELEPPFSVAPDQLREFSDPIAAENFSVHLRECGRILAAPAALSELSVRF
ncbi:MAG: hypothetical protein IKU55_00345 [Clostridia bacterium]|nr:hypothetical protein [Clostridia bacterium]